MFHRKGKKEGVRVYGIGNTLFVYEQFCCQKRIIGKIYGSSGNGKG